MMLDVKNVTVSFNGKTIIEDISFSLKNNQWLMVVGPNGAGKSTLINAVSQGVRYTGTVDFVNVNLAKIKPAELAKNIGVLTQSHFVGYSFTVEEVVKLGRYAYSRGIFSAVSEEDEEMVNKAIAMTGLEPFRKQSVTTLSGGELQRTFLAQIFAQDPKLLLLDEPTNHLDPVFQKLTFELIRKWVENTGRAVVSVVHDLSLALTYGTHALLMDKGKLVSYGKTRDVITRENLKKVYFMDVYGWMKELLFQWNKTG
ncbi:MAG: ABC transporter ATP-binding protein [Clostridiaceae bacterium]|nr:ABC transporter ATP-binding protein [Clostridiaceae bacterium]